VSDDLVVLDAHGVVFDRAFPAFVRDLAIRLDRDPTEQWAVWRNELREPFWVGRLTRDELWSRIAPGFDVDQLEHELERRFAPGPLFGAVAGSTRPLWMLTNHRSEWILPRLARFGLAGRFEQVLVSDTEGAAKPSPDAFRRVLAEAARRPVTFIDDNPRNVEAARRLGLRAACVDELPADLAAWADVTTPAATAPEVAHRHMARPDIEGAA
jgi:putative hydrolase of the HAD superfamily